ncbi:hypothetical protein SCHPADRAFT_119642 [Schizopora paradoxa]|uniref:Uncharacterized protein n=1 Tax=Schizopora paradoxa TaxID=27342 RepID=A0A0H2S3E4_9AGAM|nr:hypothetical protein SCHPADRAFT_119642 [Schizopora paradoxa]
MCVLLVLLHVCFHNSHPFPSSILSSIQETITVSSPTRPRVLTPLIVVQLRSARAQICFLSKISSVSPCTYMPHPTRTSYASSHVFPSSLSGVKLLNSDAFISASYSGDSILGPVTSWSVMW